MTNLCGHDRDVLIWALTSTGRWPEFVAGLLEPSPGLPVYTQRVLREFLAPKREPTLRAIHDPAKLAEMLAERGRELDLSIAAYVGAWQWKGTYQTEWAVMPTWGNTGTLTIEHYTFLQGGEFTMSQARTILLQWLQLPDGAREEAERVLRGET